MSCHAVNHTTDKKLDVVIGTMPCKLMPSIVRRQLRDCRYESTCICSVANEASMSLTIERIPFAWKQRDRKDTIGPDHRSPKD